MGRAAAASSQEQGAWGSQGRSPPTSVWAHPARRVLTPTPTPIFLFLRRFGRNRSVLLGPLLGFSITGETPLLVTVAHGSPPPPKISRKTGKQSSTYPIFQNQIPIFLLLYSYFLAPSSQNPFISSPTFCGLCLSLLFFPTSVSTPVSALPPPVPDSLSPLRQAPVSTLSNPPQTSVLLHRGSRPAAGRRPPGSIPAHLL